MKNLIAYLLVSIIIYEAQAQNNNSKTRIVKEYLQAAFKGDIELQKSYMHPDILDYHPTILLPPARGKEELANGWKQSMDPMDSVTYTRMGIGTTDLRQGAYSGEWVIESGMVRAKFKGMKDWVKFQMIGLYKVEEGLIVEVRNFGNLLDMYQQMGYTLKAPDEIEDK